MECPRCGLINFDTAVKCGCGYDFENARDPGSVAPAPSRFAWATPEVALTISLDFHLLLLCVLVPGGLLGGCLVGRALFGQERWLGGVVPSLVLASGVLAAALPLVILKFVVLAKCPVCSGPASPSCSAPVTYHRKSCGHLHRTSVSGGGRLGIA